MSIRMRLVLSYLAMLAVPILLSVVAVIIILVAFLGDLRSLYQTDELRGGNPIQNVIEQEASIFADIKLLTIKQPESIQQPSVIEELDQRLKKINMRLIVRQNQSILYASPSIDKPNRWAETLPAYGEEEGQDHKDFHGHLFVTRQQDFLFPDQSKGTVFIVTDANTLQKYIQQYAKWFFFSLLAILVITNGALTYLVSRSIIRPLKALKKATEQIKEGNLDFEVHPHSYDEIGELSIAFEEMRKKLKHSVELQLQYEENRKELISNISHDLKTPVTAIKGYVEGIMDGVTNSPDKMDRYVKTIYAKATDMDRLIDELFLFSKLDLGKLVFHFERVDIGHYLQDCAQELHFDMEKNGIKLELDIKPLPETGVYVKADREKLKRVLMNILENARKYMDKADGVIRLKVMEIDGRAVIGVMDNGQGISDEALPHIFDRFYRADPSRNTATGGSGLGLAIAKQIVDEHEGLIWAESKLGVGTTIFVALPIWR
ncbi:Signal transduction histidine-protein kinase BaeS [compost metagenome]